VRAADSARSVSVPQYFSGRNGVAEIISPASAEPCIGKRVCRTWLTTLDPPGSVDRKRAAAALRLFLICYRHSGRSRSMESRKRLGLLHPDGTLTVCAPDIGIEQARREAIDFDENQDDPALFTKVVSLRIDDMEILEVPSLKAAPKSRATRQPRRSRNPVA
jgi:hypothetical protein